MSDTNQPTKRGRPFPPGFSGNRNGRRRGSRNRKTIMAQKLLEDKAPDILKKLTDCALQGEGWAVKLCVERLYPARQSPRVTFKLPERLDTAADVLEAGKQVLRACAEGGISPTDGRELMDMLSRFEVILKNSELLEQIETLKEQLAILQNEKRKNAA